MPTALEIVAAYGRAYYTALNEGQTREEAHEEAVQALLDIGVPPDQLGSLE